MAECPWCLVSWSLVRPASLVVHRRWCRARRDVAAFIGRSTLDQARPGTRDRPRTKDEGPKDRHRRYIEKKAPLIAAVCSQHARAARTTAGASRATASAFRATAGAFRAT